uniref:Uncharacterized protein n=1 Tax=Leersia perrieri TaxID=77586 RepID=A0A0D9XRL9_9ORYZ
MALVSEVPVYYKPTNGGVDDMLVGLEHTLAFHYGKSSSGLLHCPLMQNFLHLPVMGRVTSGGSSNAKVTIAMAGHCTQTSYIVTLSSTILL